MDLNGLNKKNILYIFLGVASCILLSWLLHEAERVQQVLGKITALFSPFVVGACIAFILNVPMRAIEGKLKIKNDTARRVIALIITLVLVLLLIAGVFWLLIPQLIETVESLVPQVYTFFTSLESGLANLPQTHPELSHMIINNTNIENLNWTAIAEKIASVLGGGLTSILEKAVSAIGGITKFVINFFFAIVFSIYCLFQKETLARQGRRLAYAFLKEERADSLVRILRLSNSTFSNFLSGQCIEVCILGAMFAIVMSIFKMPYVPLISVLIAVTAFIPIVGAWVGCIVGCFLILVVNPVQAFWFLIIFIVIQQIEGNLIYPKVVGSSIGLSGIWVLVAIAIGGEIMGIAGMFLMIPLTSVLYTLIREATHKRLDARDIAAEKLINQPPELKSNFKEIRQNNQKKRQFRRLIRKENKNK